MRSSFFVLLLNTFALSSAAFSPTAGKKYIPPRPLLAGFHLAMSQDSAEMIMKKIALRKNSLAVDSLSLLESDSVSVFGEPAYLQLQFLKRKVRTIVVNFHPLGGEEYFRTRKTLLDYFERFFGRGVPSEDQSVRHRRWETEDGTHEVSYSDKYTRIFVRLGKKE